MKIRMFTRIVVLLCVVSFSAAGQDLSPWSTYHYGNEWMDHSKKYFRISVLEDRMHKISKETLDTEFPGINVSQIQLFHRGTEVSMGETEDGGLLFYGLKNDGAGDGLMFRPGPEARLNPYVSFFSEKGAYFLTTTSGGAKRFIAEIDGSALSGVAESYHIQTDIHTFHTKLSKHSYGVEYSANYSYYTDENSWSTEAVAGAAARITSSVKTRELIVENFKLRNWVNTAPMNPNMELLVTGMNEGGHVINVEAGTSSTNLTSVLNIPRFTGYKGQKNQFELAPSIFNSDGTAFMKMTSNTTEWTDWFGLSYYTLTYPQSTDMEIDGSLRNSAIFNFRKASSGQVRVKIENAPTGALVFDISDPSNPVPYKVIQNGSTLEAMLMLTANKEFNLLVTSASAGLSTVTDENISPVNFRPLYANYQGNETLSNVIDPSKYDFLIITHNVNPANGLAYPEYVASTIEYAKYRSSIAGGGYNTLVVDIRDLYDQFNFGEPSALGIRRFVDYMLQGAPARSKHNLLLMGSSISYPMNIKVEMNGEIPTFGDPGSDVLLVAGLAGSDIDVQALPVGRISAFTHTDIDNYMSKVKYYENYSTGESLAWRKNILDLNGASNSFEATAFNNYFDYVKTNYIPSSQHSSMKFQGTVAPNYSRYSEPGPQIEGWVNDGLGFISYFGHGSKIDMRVNLGKVSSANYITNNKFCLLYMNGCDANDIFYDMNEHYFASDWLLTPGKGAVSVVSTSYLAYHPDATTYHMYPFYASLFGSGGEKKTIGTILKEVSEGMVGSSSGRVLAATDRTRVHLSQLVLQGDPAVVLLNTSDPLPVELANFKANLLENQTVELTWLTTWEKDNSHFIVERSSDAKIFTEIGTIDGKGESNGQESYRFVDNNPEAGANYYRLVQVDIAQAGDIVGKQTVSKIVSVVLEPNGLVNIFPNPVGKHIEIKLDSRLSLASWRLLNASGVVVGQGKSKTYSTSELHPGLYILEITTNEGEVIRKKLVKEQ